MGLLDSIAGQVLGSLSQAGTQQPSGWVETIGGLLNNPQTGGLQGLVTAFEQQGLGHLISSWIGTGKNLPVSAEQLQSVLGNARIQALAQQAGLNPQELSAQLATHLPQVIDKLTPHGTIPDASGLASLLGLLKGGSA